MSFLDRINQTISNMYIGAAAEVRQFEKWPSAGSLRYNLECAKAFSILWQNSIGMSDKFRGYFPQGEEIAPYFLKILSKYLRDISDFPPDTPAKIYDMVVQCVETILSSYRKPVLLLYDINSSVSRYIYADCVRFIRLFRLVSLHEECCQLIQFLEGGDYRNSIGEHQEWYILTKNELINCLSSLPADEVPGLWQRLHEPESSEQFWPIIENMTGRNAVPYLIELFSNLQADGQNIAVDAFQRIGDSRAVPLLRTISADQNNPLSVKATKAIKNILKHSKEDAAQLVRASDAENVPGSNNTLLRPADENLKNENDSAELLRQSSPNQE